MGLILGIITGAALLANALVALWMVGAIYYDLCGGARWGRFVALAWATGVIAMLLVWRPLWQPIVALLGAESLFLGWWFRQKPSNDRDWDPSAAVLTAGRDRRGCGDDRKRPQPGISLGR